MKRRKEERENSGSDEEKSSQSKQVSEAEQERHSLHRANQQQRLILSLLLFTIVAWVIGRYDVSVVWIFVLLAWVIFWWKNTASRVVELAVKEAENDTRRQKALSNAETAEWLNFLINRW